MADDNIGTEPTDDLSRDLADIGTEEEIVEQESTDEQEDESGEEESTEVAAGAEEEEEAEEEDAEDDAEKRQELERDETGRPTIKSIKGKYPELFKDFPELKSAFYQLPKYQEVFADPEMARDAKSKSDEYDVIEETLINQTNPEFLLKTIGNNAPRALVKLMKEMPGTLQKLEHEEAYRALANPVIEDLLFHAYGYGKRTNDKNLSLAARHLANFIWANGGDIPDITKREKAKAPSDAEVQLERERESHQRERYTSAMEIIGDDCAVSVNSVLSNKLDGLTPFERKMLVKEAKEELDETLKRDTVLQSTLKSLWRKAAEDGYSPASKERIKNTWLSRAKAVAPGIRNRLKEEAVSSRSRDNGDTTEKSDQKKRTFASKGGLSSKSSSRVLDPSKIDWKKTSDSAILGDDTRGVHLKK